MYVKTIRNGEEIRQEIHEKFRVGTLHLYKWKEMIMVFYVKNLDNFPNEGSGIGYLYYENEN